MDMNKVLAAVLCVLLLGLGVGVYATIQKRYYYPQSAVIPPTPSYSLTAYIDNVLWPDSTAIDWGTSRTKQLSVKNTGDSGSVTLRLLGLPLGWTETWPVNGTVVSSGSWLNATLSLTVSESAGTYNWDSYLQIEA